MWLIAIILVFLGCLIALFVILDSHRQHEQLKDPAAMVPSSIKSRYLDNESPRENPWLALWHMGDPGLPVPLRFNWGGQCYVDDVTESNIIDRQGRRRLERWSDALTEVSEGAVIDGWKTCFFLEENRSTAPESFRFVTGFSEGRILVKNGDNLFGYLDRSMSPVIACDFIDGRDFHEGLAAVCTPSGCWQYIDLDGRPVCDVPIHPPRGFAVPVNDMVVRRRVPSSDDSPIWGYIDLKRKWSFKSSQHPPRPRDFSEGLAGVRVADSWGFIDRNGAWVITPQYLEVGAFSEGKAAVLTRTGCHYIDRRGKPAFDGVFKAAAAFRNGRARVFPLGGDGWGMIDEKGKFLVEPRFADLGDLADGVIPFATSTGTRFDPNWGLLDADGREIVPPRFKHLATFTEGVGAAREGSRRAGFIDASGAWVIEPEYEEVWPYHDGFARVQWSHL